MRRAAMKTGRAVFAVSLVGLTLAAPAYAGEADVVDVTATRSGATWRFDVTVAHADSGWDHYADRWDVLTPDGALLGSRILYHPHVDEQPFTRSLDGVTIPPGVTRVIVRAHDTVHGAGGREFTLELTTQQGG
jgi:hypothetical protein